MMGDDASANADLAAARAINPNVGVGSSQIQAPTN
jgi:hypothetical protein